MDQKTMMMKLNSNHKSFLSFIIISLFINLFAFAEDKWIIAAEKFEFAGTETISSVTDAAAEMFPVGILEKIGQTSVRIILPDEKLERKRYELKKERFTFYTQLASEYKKRDSLLLNDYSEKQLKKKIAEEDKLIAELEEKLNKNLQDLKTAEEQCEIEFNTIEGRNITAEEADKGEINKYAKLFKRMFTTEEDVVTFEQINFYKSDYTSLYAASSEAKESGYQSYAFEKDVVDSKINTLITGKITGYGEFLSVTVTAFSYPGGKRLGTVMEIGTLQEADLLITSLSRQLLPIITNALPVTVNFSVLPEGVEPQIYIDDILQNSIPENMILDSGVHTLQFVCEGYKTAGISYYFDGNKKYNIEIEFEPVQEGLVFIGLLKPLDGVFYSNGLLAEKINDQKSKIKINGNSIIGEFVTENGESAFFYVPEKLMQNQNLLYFTPKTFDKTEYLNKRRKIMYGSYSLLIVSLIPTFYTYGKFLNIADMYENGYITYEEAVKWQNAAKISSQVSIGCGVFLGFELIRYLYSANAVLPQKAKVPRQKQIEKINASEKNVEQIELDVEESAEEITDEVQQKTETQTIIINKTENQNGVEVEVQE